jgi:integrase
MAKVVWPWVNLAEQEISLPPGIIKNRKPLIVPLSDELTAILKKKFRGHGTVFETKNFRREWIKACVKCGLGEKTGEAWYQYTGLVPHDFRRSAVRNLANAGVDTATAMKDYGTSDATHLHAVQYYFDRSTSRSYGEGQVEEEGGKVNGNYNACLTQNANVILTELRYLLSYQ